MSPFLTTLGGGSVRGFGRSFRRIIAGPVQGQQAYTTAGTYTFTVPAGVTSISPGAVARGDGGGSPAGGPAGSGGNLRYVNSISVTAGESLTVIVGAGGVGGNYNGSFGAGDQEPSSLLRSSTVLVKAFGVGLSGTNVGTGGNAGSATGGVGSGGGGGGGYSGQFTGFGGVWNTSDPATAGSGGGGGGGGFALSQYDTPNVGDDGKAGGAGGGGVGILGVGSNGAAGASQNTPAGGGGGSGGSSGASGTGLQYFAVPANVGGAGGAFGAGGGAGGVWYNGALEESFLSSGGAGASGAVRIIWGTDRSYPSNAANV